MISQTKYKIKYSQPVALATLITKEGLVEIFPYVDSGKVITRKKIKTITDVDHPGFILGKDKSGRVWTAHNHISKKRPTYDTFEDYSLGQEVHYDSREVHYSQVEIVKRVIAEVSKGKAYNSINYNCQTFVNLICTNTNKSEGVDKIADAAMGTGGLMFLLGLALGNKGLIRAGMITAGVGGAGKLISRIK